MSRVRELLLIRHAEVEAKWKGVCYGSLDVELSTAGKVASKVAGARLLDFLKPATIVHSGLSRTYYLAAAIARLCGAGGDVRLLEDARLQERHYGEWQGVTWDAAYRSDPEHFHDLLEQPDSYRPPGGETTSEMQQRVVEWLVEQPDTRFPMIAISHSGPIAAIAGHVLGLHPLEWSPWIVKHLEGVHLTGGVVAGSWEITKFRLAVPGDST